MVKDDARGAGGPTGVGDGEEEDTAVAKLGRFGQQWRNHLVGR